MSHDSRELAPFPSNGMAAPPLGRGLVLRLLASFATLFVLALVGAVALREPLQEVGAWAVERMGLYGLFTLTVLLDAVPTPFSYAHLMWLLLQGGESPVRVFAVASCGSLVGGTVGFLLGRRVGLPRSLEAWLRRRHPRLLPLVENYGAWGLAAIAALPLPFALGTWSAGALGVPKRAALVALLVRIPKTGLYVFLIVSGLQLAQGVT
ncbi:MAG: YqaA family protein [Myxococcota bacterium]